MNLKRKINLLEKFKEKIDTKSYTQELYTLNINHINY